MTASNGAVDTQRLLSWMAFALAPTIAVEAISYALAGYQDDWPVAWLSVGLLPLCAYLLARHCRRTWFLFVFGCAGALVFAPRFIALTYWLQYAPPSTAGILLRWVCLALLIGLLCWGAGELRSAVLVGKALPRSQAVREGSEDLQQATESAGAQPPRLSIAHLSVWIACAALFLAVARPLQMAEAKLDERWGTEIAITMALQSPATGAALGFLLLFIARRSRNLSFPRWPGEFYLLALGVVVVMATFGAWAFESLYHKGEWFKVIQFVQMLLMVVAVANVPLRWSLYFASEIAVTLLAWLGPYTLLSHSAWLPWIILVIVVVRDVRDRVTYPWTHWAAVATAAWLFLVQAGWTLWTIVSPTGTVFPMTLP